MRRRRDRDQISTATTRACLSVIFMASAPSCVAPNVRPTAAATTCRTTLSREDLARPNGRRSCRFAAEMAESNVVIEVRGLTKRYGHARGVDDLTFEVGPGRGVRVPGPQRRRQDDDDPNPAGLHPADLGLGACVRPRTRAARASSVHGRVGYLPGELALYERITGEEVLRYVRRPARRRSGIRGRVARARRPPRRGPDQTDPRAVARQQAEDRPRAGVHARPRSADPGRTHPGPRPARAADLLLDGRGGARARRHHLPELARHARGRAPLRPRRHHPRGSPRDGRRHRRAEGEGAAPPRVPLRRARAGVGVRAPAGCEGGRRARRLGAC